MFVVAAPAGSAYAIDLPAISPGITSNPGISQGQLQNLQNQQQRLNFQQQQNQNRQEDRQSVTPPRQLDLNVPVTRPNCRTQLYGNQYLRSCS